MDTPALAQTAEPAPPSSDPAAAAAQESRRPRRPGHHVVIVGGGFGGLSTAQGLADVPGIEVTLVDRRNHHLFQPLLYQVATAVLAPGEIAQPLRGLLGRRRNVE